MKFIKNRSIKYLNSFEDADRIEFLQSGIQYFDTLINLINSANESIHLQMYILNDDQIGRIVLEVLLLAAKRGVIIYVVADGFGSNNLTSDYIDNLKKAGINFRIFSRISLFKNLNIGRRMHHKILIVDRKKGLVGGINIADKYYGENNKEPWLDFAILIEGTVCEQLRKICSQIEEKKYYQKSLQESTSNFSNNPMRINIRQNDWLRNKKEISQSYYFAIRNAEKSILIFASYFLPGMRLRMALESAARRGVKIKVVLPGISDIPLVLNATYYLYHWMHKNKIRIYEWRKSVLHAKLAVIDDEWMTIGSFNLNLLSTYASIELNIDVLNAAFVIQSRTILDKIIEDGCEEITSDRKRPLSTRIREALAYFLGRTLIKIITFFPTFKNFDSKMID